MTCVEKKREEVLAQIYDRLLEEDGLDEFFDGGVITLPDGKKVSKNHPAVQLIATLENARAADTSAFLKKVELDLEQGELKVKEGELKLKDDCALVDNANKEIDRKQAFKVEVLKALITAGVSVVTTAAWGMIFVHELKATRLFEIEGTEISAAGRWLKNSFPKPRF